MGQLDRLFRYLDRFFTVLNVFPVPVALLIDVLPCALICYICAVDNLALISLSMVAHQLSRMGRLVWSGGL